MDTPTLLGTRLDLVPLRVEHAEQLFPVLDPGVFAILVGRPREWSVDAFRGLLTSLCRDPGRMPFALWVKQRGLLVGSSSLFDFRHEHRGVEVGSTWIARPWQGTFVNPEAKFLMLRHAFEGLGMLRVQFKTDLRNVQSQRALEKLGCSREGVLRKHMVLPDGHVRDSVYYSITNDEWPRIKQELLVRLAALA